MNFGGQFVTLGVDDATTAEVGRQVLGGDSSEPCHPSYQSAGPGVHVLDVLVAVLEVSAGAGVEADVAGIERLGERNQFEMRLQLRVATITARRRSCRRAGRKPYGSYAEIRWRRRKQCDLGRATPHRAAPMRRLTPSNHSSAALQPVVPLPQTRGRRARQRIPIPYQFSSTPDSTLFEVAPLAIVELDQLSQQLPEFGRAHGQLSPR